MTKETFGNSYDGKGSGGGLSGNSGKSSGGRVSVSEGRHDIGGSEDGRIRVVAVVDQR